MGLLGFLGFTIAPTCRVRIAVGLTIQDAQGKRRAVAPEHHVRKVVEHFFPNGHTLVRAMGGWKPDNKPFVREPSLVIEVTDPDASDCPGFFRQADRLARGLAKRFEQTSVLVQYEGASGSMCAAFITPNGRRSKVRGQCRALLGMRGKARRSWYAARR